MSAMAGDPAPERLARLYRDKARAEITDAEGLAGAGEMVRPAGDELADVMLLKGEPGPEDIEASRVLAGADGEAADKALDALGLSPARFAACTRASDSGGEPRSDRLRLLVEAVDPRVIVALDPVAAADLAAAYEVEVPPAGRLARMNGRDVVALDGLQASLGDEALKRRVWRQLQALKTTAAADTHRGRP
jgi:hypothetical protein